MVLCLVKMQVKLQVATLQMWGETTHSQVKSLVHLFPVVKSKWFSQMEKMLLKNFSEIGMFRSGLRHASALNLSVRHLQENCP